MSLLETYVRGWREAADGVLALAPALGTSDWEMPTDCPGWTVKDVVAHLAHIESELCHPAQHAYGDSGAGDLTSAYTEAGVAERKDRAPAGLIAELASAVEQRSSMLAELPDDPAAPAGVTPGGIAWSWDTLLRNRSIDMWVHEQDIRRAIGRPGGLRSTGAEVVTMTFSLAMPYVLGKRVKPPAGSTVRWDMSGEVPVDLGVRMGDDGSAARVDGVEDPTTTLSMSTETFTVLAAGRRAPQEVDVTITGDEKLGHATLAAMAITP
jgi:uncharacterized protein (TIGR03083 family)